MPYALIIAGIVLTVAGVRATQGQLFALLGGDFTGSNSFIWWALSIIGIGSVGYVADLRKLANAFLALVLIVLFLGHSGVFQQFISALQAPIMPVSGQPKPSYTPNQSDTTAPAAVSSGTGTPGLLSSLGGFDPSALLGIFSHG